MQCRECEGDRMDLKLSLVLRIVAAGAACLLFTAGYVLYRADRDWQDVISATAQSAVKQLNKQLLQISWGLSSAAEFPDWQTAPGMDTAPGLCVMFAGPEGRLVKNVCGGWDGSSASAPAWFSQLFRWTFRSSRPVTLAVSFRNVQKGFVTVSDDSEAAASQAWRDVRPLLGLQSISIAAICVIIFGVVRQALQPANAIIGGLGRLERGELSARLPRFRLTEFQSISAGFNRLAGHLQQSIAERAELTRRLFQVQEDERRALARDLHDEFGQCLAAIHALAAAINESCKEGGSGPHHEGQAIAKICDRMMQTLRGTLAQLRPLEAEQGLVESLHSLVNDWNMRLKGKTVISFEVKGDVRRLPAYAGGNIFRIVQECLTNAAKHAHASRVDVRLECGKDAAGPGVLELIVEDDGRTPDSRSPGPAGQTTPGMGLLGIRERVAALGGTLTIKAIEPHGMAVRTSIPAELAPAGASL
jgi:two-component system, NarL family, sensor histidine kinase UhpB